MIKRSVIAILILMGLLFGCTEQVEQTDSWVAPDFKLKDMKGQNVRLSDYRGKVVLLEFWATWCPPCRAAIPGLERLHTTYKDKGFVILAVSLDNLGWDAVRTFIKDYRITYTVLQGTEEVGIAYRVRAVPLALLLDKKGAIAAKHVGFIPDDELEKELKALL